jgi:hypothetical protein
VPLTPVTLTYFIQSPVGGYQDVSTDSQLITSSGAINATSVRTTKYKFGTQSSFYYTSGYQIVTDNPSIRLSGDFTIEGWVYRMESDVYHGIMFKGAIPNGFEIAVTGANRLYYYTPGSNLNFTSTDLIPANTWTYFAITRSGTTGYMFVNGNLQGTYSDIPLTNTSNLYIGTESSTTLGLYGYLDDIRITDGICRYTSSFGAPSSAFPTN